MITVVNVVVQRRHGKLYPARLATAAERRRARLLAHHLHCRDGLSFRETQRRLTEYGLVRSLGWVHREIQRWECPRRRWSVASERPRP